MADDAKADKDVERARKKSFDDMPMEQEMMPGEGLYEKALPKITRLDDDEDLYFDVSTAAADEDRESLELYRYMNVMDLPEEMEKDDEFYCDMDIAGFQSITKQQDQSPQEWGEMESASLPQTELRNDINICGLSMQKESPRDVPQLYEEMDQLAPPLPKPRLTLGGSSALPLSLSGDQDFNKTLSTSTLKSVPHRESFKKKSRRSKAMTRSMASSPLLQKTAEPPPSPPTEVVYESLERPPPILSRPTLSTSLLAAAVPRTSPPPPSASLLTQAAEMPPPPLPPASSLPREAGMAPPPPPSAPSLPQEAERLRSSPPTRESIQPPRPALRSRSLIRYKALRAELSKPQRRSEASSSLKEPPPPPPTSKSALQSAFSLKEAPPPPCPPSGGTPLPRGFTAQQQPTPQAFGFMAAAHIIPPPPPGPSIEPPKAPPHLPPTFGFKVPPPPPPLATRVSASPTRAFMGPTFGFGGQPPQQQDEILAPTPLQAPLFRRPGGASPPSSSQLFGSTRSSRGFESTRPTAPLQDQQEKIFTEPAAGLFGEIASSTAPSRNLVPQTSVSKDVLSGSDTLAPARLIIESERMPLHMKPKRYLSRTLESRETCEERPGECQSILIVIKTEFRVETLFFTS